MRWLRFILNPAHAAPEARHEPSAEALAAHHQAEADETWDRLALETRLEIAEFRLELARSEIRTLTDDCGVLPVPLHIRSRLAHLEQANATLTAQLDQATTYIRDLTEQVETMRARLNHPTNRQPPPNPNIGSHG